MPRAPRTGVPNQIKPFAQWVLNAEERHAEWRLCERRSFSAKLGLEFVCNRRLGKAVCDVELLIVPAASSIPALDSTLPVKLLHGKCLVAEATCWQGQLYSMREVAFILPR